MIKLKEKNNLFTLIKNFILIYILYLHIFKILKKFKEGGYNV